MELARIREIMAERFDLPLGWERLIETMDIEPVQIDGRPVAALVWERIHGGLFLHLVAEPDVHGRWITRAALRRHILPKLRTEPIMMAIPSDRPDLLSYAERMECRHVEDGPISQLWVWPMRRS